MSAVLREPEILRVPPHAVDAERSVLGALLIAPESLAKVADWLTVDDFYRDAHRVIFSAIMDLSAKRQPIDAVTLGDQFVRNSEAGAIGGPAYLTELANATPGAANIVAYAEIVVEKARLRRLIETGTRLAGDAFDGRSGAQDLIATTVHTLSQMQAGGVRSGLRSVKTALRDLYAEMSSRFVREPGLIGLPTPWHAINERLDGLQDGNLYIVAARPSMGKSVFGGQIAVMNALRGDRVAWFSVEMTAAQCMARAVACLADIDYRWVRNPDNKNPDSETWWSAVTRANELLLRASLSIDDTPALTIAQLMASARREHLRKPLRLIVIDHAHDMKINPQLARFEYGEIAQGAKTLAKEMGCPVVLLAQLNRGVENRADKRPALSDLRESGAFEEKADVVLFLHRDDYYTRERNPGMVDVIVAKGRDVGTGAPIHLRHRFDRMRLQDWDGPEPDANVDSDAGKAVARWKHFTSKRA